MNKIIMQRFIAQNKKLDMEFHPSSNNAIIIRNCSFEQGTKLCKKYKASGSSCGKNLEHFMILNFGEY